MALFALSLSWSNMAWNRNFCGSAARNPRIGTSAFVARLASVSLLWQMSFPSRKPCHWSPAKSCSRGRRAVAPWLIVFGRQGFGFGSRVGLAQSSVARIVALGCRVPYAGKPIFQANVRDDRSPLAFGVAPANAGGVPKMPKAC